jgi:hypothetical protein
MNASILLPGCCLEADSFFDGELVGKLGLLELNSDALTELSFATTPIQAEQLDRSGVGCGETLTYLDRSGLSGSVGAEQPEALAGGDF